MDRRLGTTDRRPWNDGSSSLEKDLNIHVKSLNPCFEMPRYQTVGASGFDLCSMRNFALRPGQVGMVELGFSIAIPQGWEGQVRMRSGLAKLGIMLANGVGTVDSDYRGEVCALLYNGGSKTFYIELGMRVCQMVIARVESVSLILESELDATTRGAGGFGSTGLSWIVDRDSSS